MQANNLTQLRKITEEDGKVSKILLFSLQRLAEDVKDGLVSMDSESKRILTNITKNTELRWEWISKRLKIRCPECATELNGWCARFKCYVCGEELMLQSKTLHNICETCPSYKNTCGGSMDDSLEEPLVIRIPYKQRKAGEIDVDKQEK